MPRMGEDARDQRRREFVEAAQGLLAEKSYRDLTVEEVCVRARMSKGSFYTHFKSKRDLLLALLHDDADMIDSFVEQVEPGRVRDARRVVKALLRGVIAMAEDPARRQLRADLWAAADTDSDVLGWLGEGVGQRRRRLTAWVEAAQQSGDLIEIPANAFAAILLALADGLALHAGADPGGFRWANISRAVEMLIDGLAPREQPVS
jgi:AcrR family transcriptional regulator